MPLGLAQAHWGPGASRTPESQGAWRNPVPPVGQTHGEGRAVSAATEAAGLTGAVPSGAGRSVHGGRAGTPLSGGAGRGERL